MGSGMRVQFVPLLQIQHDLYALPRGMGRFRQYLSVMIGGSEDDLDLMPLVVANPMAKDHVTARLDALLSLGADRLAAEAVAEAENDVGDVPGEFKASLVLADDVGGGWTNRYASEFGSRFQTGPSLKRGWVSGVLWSSEEPSEQRVRETTLAAIHRAAYILRHGPARTLREMLAQEGFAMNAANCRKPVLEPDDLAYTREVIAPFLDAEDMRTCIECLYGDAAGKTLGFTPRGLSDRAGLALALADATCPVPQSAR